MVSELFAPAPRKAADPKATAAAAAGDAGLGTLRTVVRDYSGRNTLGDADLARLADAQADAACEQAEASTCSAAASDIVTSLVRTVCARQIEPGPPFANDTARLLYDSKVTGCLQRYSSILLSRLHEKATEAIRKIKSG